MSIATSRDLSVDWREVEVRCDVGALPSPFDVLVAIDRMLQIVRWQMIVKDFSDLADQIAQQYMSYPSNLDTTELLTTIGELVQRAGVSHSAPSGIIEAILVSNATHPTQIRGEILNVLLSDLGEAKDLLHSAGSGWAIANLTYRNPLDLLLLIATDYAPIVLATAWLINRVQLIQRNHYEIATIREKLKGLRDGGTREDRSGDAVLDRKLSALTVGNSGVSVIKAAVQASIEVAMRAEVVAPGLIDTISVVIQEAPLGGEVTIKFRDRV